MRYDYKYDEQLFGYVYEEELKKLNLVILPKLDVTFVRHNYLESTDDENILNTDNYSYAYDVTYDEFATIVIRHHNGRVYDRTIWNTALTSPIIAITVTYNGTDEVE